MFSSRGQDVKGDDIVCASWVNVDQPVADIGVSRGFLGNGQPEQVIYQEGMGINQTATSSSNNILI